MKIAITGKGGVGKTSLSYLLGLRYRDLGFQVLLVDADPDGNLPDLMGLSATTIVPLIEMKEMIHERIASDQNGISSYFKLNPKVDDIPQKYALTHNGLKLLVMGTIKSGGGGCACPLNSFIRQVLRHLIIEREEIVIMDMEAGIEHLGRGTADQVDCLLIITEPNMTALTTTHRIIHLAQDLKIPRLLIVGNKIFDEQDKRMIITSLGEVEPIFIPFSRHIKQISCQPEASPQLEPEVAETLTSIVNQLNTS
ncbi:ArsA-related P-loop ATPase [candidate division CSSED10-310 bacterium]|uniref:ArsA-related P-loop ATPase n=1 Tax=candidate division CSSED10-310 bacterium TaxID=2855610 RepID=A0ABV6Z3W7_UNCC1